MNRHLTQLASGGLVGFEAVKRENFAKSREAVKSAIFTAEKLSVCQVSGPVLARAGSTLHKAIAHRISPAIPLCNRVRVEIPTVAVPPFPS